MPEIAFETSLEEERNSEDDIMSDEEDELRLRQVARSNPSITNGYRYTLYGRFAPFSSF